MKPHSCVSFTVRILGSILLSGLVFISLGGKASARRAADSPACIRYVNVNSTGSTQDGLGWGTAYKDLQASIPIVAALGPCELWVAEGTYHLTGTRFASFVLYNNLAIYGGFSGSETLISQRNWLAHPSYLSGEIGTSAHSDNAESVVYAYNVNNTAILDGFFIKDGDASGSYVDGAGIYIKYADPKLSNLKLLNNHAEGNGGAIYVEGGQPVLDNISVWSNDASNGGGIYITGNSTVSIDGAEMAYNLATAQYGEGGAISKDTTSDLTLSHASLHNNNAVSGGGAHIDGHADISNSVIFLNTAQGGGGLWADAGTGSLSIINAWFDRNTASNKGGGIYIYGSSPSIIGTTFSRNDNTINGYGGGAIGMYQSSPIFTNLTLAGNTSPKGGGIYLSQNSHPVVRNSILWGDTGKEIYDDTFYTASTVSISYSLVQGCKPAGAWNTTDCDTDGGHNLTDADPRFKNSPPYNYELLWNSPAIDQGNSAWVSGITMDLAQNLRIFGHAVDLGAFESHYFLVHLPMLIR